MPEGIPSLLIEESAHNKPVIVGLNHFKKARAQYLGIVFQTD